MPSLIETFGLRKDFRMAGSSLNILKGIDLAVGSGEFIGIMGPSGSGKSTLLHILGCLERPTAGQFFMNGLDMANAADRTLSHIRADAIGFVFQTFNLIPQLNVYENIELAMLYSTVEIPDAHQKIMRAIDQVGLKNRVNHRPSELSGGEMQRVAIARAFCMNPKIILADEPTGNLDSETGREILKIFKKLNQDGTTILLVTHDREVASFSGRVLFLKDGVIE